jgi:predicted RNase H-like HicB family nuclease
MSPRSGKTQRNSGRRAKPRQFQASFLHRGKWWVAWCEDVPGALTQGQTLDEARDNLRDAITLMLEPVDVEALPSAKTRVVHEVLEL